MSKMSVGKARVLRVLGLALLFPVISVATSLSQTPPGVTMTIPGANKAPAVTGFTAYQVANKKFVVSGQVADERPGNCKVTIGGVGAGGPFQVSATGTFNGTVTVQNVGQLTATPNDGILTGAPFPYTLQNTAPTISVTAIAGDGGSWTFSGNVADEAPGGLTVVLTGFPEGVTQNVTVAANGTFSVTVTPPLNSSATITATVTDWFGATGSAATLYGS